MTTSVLYDANNVVIDAAFTQDRTTSALKTTHFKRMCVHAIWTSLTGVVDATISIQGSCDATNWDSLCADTLLSNASGNDLIMIDNVYCSYVRIVATKNNVTGGTIKAIVSWKE